MTEYCQYQSGALAGSVVYRRFNLSLDLQRGELSVKQRLSIRKASAAMADVKIEQHISDPAGSLSQHGKIVHTFALSGHNEGVTPLHIMNYPASHSADPYDWIVSMIGPATSAFERYFVAV